MEICGGPTWTLSAIECSPTDARSGPGLCGGVVEALSLAWLLPVFCLLSAAGCTRSLWDWTLWGKHWGHAFGHRPDLHSLLDAMAPNLDRSFPIPSLYAQGAVETFALTGN